MLAAQQRRYAQDAWLRGDLHQIGYFAVKNTQEWIVEQIFKWSESNQSLLSVFQKSVNDRTSEGQHHMDSVAIVYRPIECNLNELKK